MNSEGRPRAFRDFVAHQLAMAMASGELPSGTRLSPIKLAAKLGVSHIPVRESLVALETTGQVKWIPRIGFFVAELSPDDVEDIYHWRQVLEDEAHRLAVPKLELADLAKMRRLNEAIRETMRDRDVSAFIELNRAFHFVPFERVDSEHLMRFIASLWDAAGRYQNAMVFTRVPRSVLQEHHDALMEAFEERDVGAVNGWMAKHRAVTVDAIRRRQATITDGTGIADDEQTAMEP